MPSIPRDLVPLSTQPWSERPVELPLDVEECRTALWQAGGNVTRAADILRVPSTRLRKFIKGSPRLMREMEEVTEQVVDLAQDVVVEALSDPEDAGRRDTMARYVLSSQGKPRGWGTGQGKVTINNSQGGKVIIGWADGSAIGDGDDAKVIEHE